MNKENITRRYIDRYLSQENLSASRIIDVTSMDLLIEFAKIDLGIACVIKNFVRDELAEGRLVQLKMPVSIPARKIGFAYAKSGAIPPTVRKLPFFFARTGSPKSNTRPIRQINREINWDVENSPTFPRIRSPRKYSRTNLPML